MSTLVVHYTEYLKTDGSDPEPDWHTMPATATFIDCYPYLDSTGTLYVLANNAIDLRSRAGYARSTWQSWHYEDDTRPEEAQT